MTPQQALIKKLNEDGPDKKDYELINQICKEQPEVLNEIKAMGLDFLHSTKSIMGHIRIKPYNYAGDFEIIDRIYTNKSSDEYKKWDDYALSNSAAKAVKNRKEYFKKLIIDRFTQKKQLNVLNIASGPARDVFELYEEFGTDKKINFTCLDIDDKAISYAKTLNAEHLDKISFINENILKYDSKIKYDLIWSAGLFDYFNDKVFVSVLMRMRKWIKPDGEIIIGNFNEDHNPSRNYMEIIGEWYLHHRNKTTLRKLGLKAGLIDENINVFEEPERVNLFLHINTASDI